MTRSADNRQTLDEAQRRRTIAVISHPDAGKSTLTEALLLHAHAIGEAGAVHGKAGRRKTVSDWMDMEKARGISISSAAIQFEHDGTVINLVDTPGHSDFSEDTYRVLSAVDCAIMLVDASKGLEAQTMKLFDVCRKRKIPIITMINKWDRPGLEALALMDEIEDRTKLLATPVNWPVGRSGDFQGLLTVTDHSLTTFNRTAGGSTVASEDVFVRDAAADVGGPAWEVASEEVSLLALEGHTHDETMFLAGESTPVLFGAAVHNLGVRALLEAIVSSAPSADARLDVSGTPRSVDSSFSGFVFKVQSGMDAAHRDRLAFIRVCSGTFERGMTAIHAQTQRPFATKYAQQLFGRERETVDVAWPGDIVGLVNANALRPGDTLYVGDAVQFPPLPQFAPEYFRSVRAVDSSKHKQFKRGIDQLELEGVIQVLRSERRGHVPVLGAVGPMQFEVVDDRMAKEFNCPIVLDELPYTIARATTAATAAQLDHSTDAEVLTRSDGTRIALVSTIWRLRAMQRNNPDLVFESLGVDTQDASLALA
ncbi:MAG: peptide chain release factor 3 [Mycetocola sp.]